MHNLKCIMPIIEGLAIFIAFMTIAFNLGIDLRSLVGVVILIGVAGLSFISGAKTYFLYGGKTK